MLDVIRKNAGSWLIKVILGAIVLVFVFWGVGSFNSSRMDVVATVNGDKIMLSSYRDAYNNAVDRYSKMFGGQIPESFMKQLNLKHQVLESLIDSALIRQECARMGIIVSDKEVQDVVMHIGAFQKDGVFNKDYYIRALGSVKMSPAGFEENVRQGVEKEKFMSLVNAGLYVPDAEAMEHYMFNNQEIDLSYAMVTSGECSSEVNATEKDIASWYESHKETFITKPRIQLRYVLFDRESMVADANITEAAITEYYEKNPSEFQQPEQRKASHILLRIPQGAGQDVVDQKKKEIEKIRAELLKGGDFAAVAQEKSEDPGSAPKGGDLGMVKKGMMVKPFEEALFAMKSGEISEPVRTTFGWHIIRLEKIEPEQKETLAQVHDRIKKNLQEKTATQLVWDRANKAYDMIIELGGIEALSKEEKLPIKTTVLFDEYTVPPVLGGNPAVKQTLFSLQKGELTSLIEVPAGVLIAEVENKIAPHIPELAKVRKRVINQVVDDKAKKLCMKKARGLLEAAKKNGLAKAASALSVTVEDTGFFKRTDAASGGKLPAVVLKASAGLFDGKKYTDDVVENGSVFYVLEFKAEKSASVTGFESGKKEIVEKLLKNKQQKLIDQWLVDQRKKAEVDYKMKL